MKKVGLISLSNGLSESHISLINRLEEIFTALEIQVVRASTIFNKNGITSSGKERAIELMKLYTDKSIDTVFDVSGGDLANETLLHLDWNIIKNNPKDFYGYSDLSTIVNSIYSQTNKPTYLYQIRNIALDDERLKDFINYITNKDRNFTTFNYKWLQGDSMEGIVVGGNIRCTLKLAGTKFMPDFTDKILFIESCSGDVSKITTFLAQYKLIGAFDKIKGIILGQYTEMERDNLKPTVEELVLKIVNNPNIPIVKTYEIGHSANSKCIVIGKNLKLDK